MDDGQLIAGRYRLRERLGQGGMSVVWRADDDVLGREVAVKVMSPAALAGDPGIARRIKAEARAAARLRHPGIVAVFDYGELTEGDRQLSYVVMELVDGRSLNDMLTGGRLPWKLVVLVGAQVAAALAAAHEAGIVHRDVKPGNVMVTSSGVKLVDFGISAAVGELDGPDGILLGTPAYLAPERIEGGPVRPAADVYALGLLLYRALAGEMPWDAFTVTQMVKAHVYVNPEPLPWLAGLPAEAARLITRCLAKRADDRPSSAEVAGVLGRLAGLPPPAMLASAAEPTVAMARPRVRRPRRALLAAAGVAAVLTLGTSWWALGGTAAPTQADAVTPACVGCTGSVPPSSPVPTTPTGTPKPSPKVTTEQVVNQRKKKTAGSKARKGAGRPAAVAPAPGPEPKAKPGRGPGPGAGPGKHGPPGPKK